MDLILNELSHSLEWTEFQATPIFDTFFTVCLSIEKDVKCKVFIKYSNSIFQNDSNFQRWLSLQNKDEKSRILSMLTGSQFILEHPYYKFENDYGLGIGYAFENEDLLFSFQSDDKWKLNYLNIIHEQLDENVEIITTDEKIRNCHDSGSKSFHLEFLSNKILYLNDINLNKIKKEITKGKQLWENRDSLFSHLIFCDSVKDYIQNIQSGYVLQNLINRLYQYEIYFRDWVDGDFEISKVKGRPRLESETRINNYQELIVLCPDGKNRTFSYHCNYGVDGFRLHFFPYIPENNETGKARRCIIGYIGKKII
ncbi:TPA: hypothetical protein ACG0AG_001758 [Elizabethkingia anophelis]